MENISYIERAYSLSKKQADEPWRLEVAHPFDAEKRLVYYLADDRHPGGFHEDRPVLAADEKFDYILNELVKRIERYPYFWPLEGQKIDAYGYDFYSYLQKGQAEDDAMEIGMTEVADTIVREKLSIASPPKEAWRTLTAEDYVEGKGIGIRVEVLLEKAGSVNHVGVELFTAKEVELAAVLYQEDDKQYTPMKELILDGVGVVKSRRSMTVNFPSAVYAKRIVLIFRQQEYVVNKYKLPKEIVAQKQILSYIKEEEARKTAEAVGSRQYVTDYKSEHFADLFVKSGLKGWADVMRKYRQEHEAWLKQQKK